MNILALHQQNRTPRHISHQHINIAKIAARRRQLRPGKLLNSAPNDVSRLFKPVRNLVIETLMTRTRDPRDGTTECRILHPKSIF